jgi:DNA-binding transcriptional regulator YdaS (Cro superfamily)
MTLAEYVARPGDCAALAKKLGVPHSTVWRWAKGERMPGANWAALIAKVTRGAVPSSSWLSKRRPTAA